MSIFGEKLTQEEKELREANDREHRIIQNHAAMLMEHFDCVQIFASKHKGETVGTITFNHGAGNYFARFGQVEKWVDEERNV